MGEEIIHIKSSHFQTHTFSSIFLTVHQVPGCSRTRGQSAEEGDPSPALSRIHKEGRLQGTESS